MSAAGEPNRSWVAWVPTLLFTALFFGTITVACVLSDIAREVLAKAVMYIVGVISTPFVLETTFALIGLFIVFAINHRRIQKEGDGWVYLAVTQPDAESVAAGAGTPAHRLDAMVLEKKPDLTEDFEGRVAIAEGYLELGLIREALEHLRLLTTDEQATERVQRLRQVAESRPI